jgi:hypothetical protein
MRSKLREWFQRAFLATLGAILLSVLAQFFIQVAADKGYYSGAGRRWDHSVSWLLTVLSSVYMIALSVFLGGVTVGLYFDRALARKEARTPSLTEVRGKVFVNEVVDLDGKRFVKCEFRGVRLRYAGGPYQLDRCSFDESLMVEPVGEPLTSYTAMLAEFRLLAKRIMTDDGPYLTNTKIREGGSGESA